MNQPTCIITIVLSVLCAFGCTPNVQAGGQEYSELRVSRQMPLHGIYDPSLEYAKDAGWMTYSLIEMPNISTCLAKSTDSGRSWA